MKGDTTAKVALAVLCLALTSASASASATKRRALLQTGSSGVVGSTSLYSPTSRGGLSLESNYSVSLTRRGRLVAGQVNATSEGYTVLLEDDDIIRSAIFQNTGCMDVRLQTTSNNVAAFLTSYADYLAMSGGSTFALSAANVVGATNLSSATPRTVRARTSPDDQYVFVIYSVDRLVQEVVYQVIAYQPNAPECRSPTPAPSPGELTIDGTSSSLPPTRSRSTANAPTGSRSTARGPAVFPRGRRLQQTSGTFSNAPAPAPAGNLVQTVQINRQDLLEDSSLVWPAGFTNASCIAYKLLGQGPVVARSNLIDVTVFILDEDNTLEWASEDFDLRPTNVTMLAACYQNNSAPGDCGGYLDRLQANKTYFLWAVTGMQQPRVTSSDIIFNLAYTAQASGSCANNAVQAFKDNSYNSNVGVSYDYESSEYYDYDDYYFYDYSDSGSGGAASGASSSSSSSSSRSPPGSYNRSPPPPSRDPDGTPSSPSPPPSSGVTPSRDGGQGSSTQNLTSDIPSAAPAGGISLRGSGSEPGKLFPLPGR